MPIAKRLFQIKCFIFKNAEFVFKCYWNLSNKVWSEMTRPFPNFQRCNVEVWECIFHSSHTL